jgi:hypothetical protein
MLSLFKFFKCKSSCAFNSDEIDCPKIRGSIDYLNNNFQLNEKDIKKIYLVLNGK